MLNFKIFDLSITKVEGKPAVIATLTTNDGAVELLEWLNGNIVERRNSHIRSKQFNVLARVLDFKISSQAKNDVLLHQVYDAIDEELKNK